LSLGNNELRRKDDVGGLDTLWIAVQREAGIHLAGVTNFRRVAKMGQFGRNGSATLQAMTTQTIAEYLDEERQKAADTELRTEAEAARIQPLQHGHHRTAKQPRLELVPPVKAAAKKKQKRKTAAVARKKPRAAKKRVKVRVTKIRKRA
jgi:hypothetical protein